MKLNKVQQEVLNLIDKANKDGKFLTGDQLKTVVGEKRFTQAHLRQLEDDKRIMWAENQSSVGWSIFIRK